MSWLASGWLGLTWLRSAWLGSAPLKSRRARRGAGRQAGDRARVDGRAGGRFERPTLTPLSMTGDSTAPLQAPDVHVFEAHRGLLFSLAYRMLGSASEAEDVVQDAYVRYAGAQPRAVRSPRAWLGTIVTRLCLDRLKAARTTREQYVGPWLPEPMLEGDREPGLVRAIEQRESITLAFLVLLESLTPQERAVFLLREVFDYDYRDIGEMLDLSPANCRQLFHRAKQRVTEHRPRYRPSRARHQQFVEAFIRAASEGDAEALRAVLTEDVVLTADGGGKATVAGRPIVGPDAVARMWVGIKQRVERLAAERGAPASIWRMTLGTVNGIPAVFQYIDGGLDSVLSFETSPDGIFQIAVVRNPDKLTYIQRQLDAAPRES